MTILIAAGNYDEAKAMAYTYCLPRSNWKYIDCPNVFVTFNKAADVIWLAKNWKKHPEASEIQSAINRVQCSVQRPKFHGTP